MRKFLALALAVAMVMSLAAVSFAFNTVADITIEGPYRYKADENDMLLNAQKRYGEGAYYMIKITDGDEDAHYVTSYKEVEKLKVKADFEMGADLVESVSIVKKFVDNLELDNDDDTDDSGYYYFVEVKVANKQTTADADIIGTFEFNRKADKDVGDNGIGKIKDVEIDFEINVFYGDTYLSAPATSSDEYSYYYVGKDNRDEVELKYDTNYALKFDSDDEVEFQFGESELNEGTFTVDVSGQGKLFLRYNTTPDEAIVAANPGAKLFFVNFNNVKFNRVGEFVYEMDDIAAAYKVVDGKLVEIKGLELDADSATFNTRVLESYVFADAELVNPVAAVEAPAVEAPAATNPSTGANA